MPFLRYCFLKKEVFFWFSGPIFIFKSPSSKWWMGIKKILAWEEGCDCLGADTPRTRSKEMMMVYEA